MERLPKLQQNAADKPLDSPRIQASDYQNPVLNHPDRPTLHEIGTHENVRTIYLQRLADPELHYDPVDNPYITVDWISSDLTLFNGEDTATPVRTMAFQSRYKDGGDARLRQGEAGDLEAVGIKALVNPNHPVQLRRKHYPPSFSYGCTKTANHSLGTQMITASTAPLVETPTFNGPML